MIVKRLQTRFHVRFRSSFVQHHLPGQRSDKSEKRVAVESHFFRVYFYQSWLKRCDLFFDQKYSGKSINCILCKNLNGKMIDKFCNMVRNLWIEILTVIFVWVCSRVWSTIKSTNRIKVFLRRKKDKLYTFRYLNSILES